MVLPGETKLREYKNCVTQDPGIQDNVFVWMHDEADRLKLSEEQRHGGIIFDEMSIQVRHR